MRIPTPQASVTGKVTYKGEPVPAGLINFIPKTEGPSATGSLIADGTYSITDAPAGEFTVTIDNESLNPDKKLPQYPGMLGGSVGAYQQPNARRRRHGKQPYANIRPRESHWEVCKDPGPSTPTSSHLH